MFPQMGSAFFNWTEAVQMQIIHQSVSDFEPVENVISVVTFEAVIQAMSPKLVQRKPENLRSWKWWEMWSTTHVESNTVFQDPNGLQFQVQSTQDWGQAGFYHSEVTQRPQAQQPEPSDF